MITKSKIFEVYEDISRKKLFTINLTPGKSVYEESLVKQNNIEYREWDPFSSKLAALILNKCQNIFLRKNDVVLYLGSASGTTASHVSDIVGRDGFIFAVDLAPRVMRDLIFNLEASLEANFEQDGILARTGIFYEPSLGRTLRILRIGKVSTLVDSGDELAELALTGQAPQGYITEEETVDVLFGLSRKLPAYVTKHKIALALFQKHLDYGVFKDEFNNFDMKEDDGTRYFNRKKIQGMRDGKNETIEGSGDTFTVHLHYIVPVNEPKTMIRIFSLGAYKEEEMQRKYGFSYQKMTANFEDEGGDDITKKDRIRITTPEGDKLSFYKKEDIESIIGG